MYKTILVPLDGSKRAEAILPHVENLARRYDAGVIFLGVIEPEPVAVASGFAISLPEPRSYEQRLEEVETYLISQQENFHKKGVDAQRRVGDGPIVKTIINAAEHLNVDIVAMASHGRTGLSRVFYGSVAAGVLHQIDRPLLLIRSLDNGNS